MNLLADWKLQSKFGNLRVITVFPCQLSEHIQYRKQRQQRGRLSDVTELARTTPPQHSSAKTAVPAAAALPSRTPDPDARCCNPGKSGSCVAAEPGRAAQLTSRSPHQPTTGKRGRAAQLALRSPHQPTRDFLAGDFLA